MAIYNRIFRSSSCLLMIILLYLDREDNNSSLDERINHKSILVDLSSREIKNS